MPVSGAGRAEAIQSEESAKAFGNLAETLSAAAQKIQSREDSIEYVNKITEYEEYATDLLRKTALERDISDRGVLEGVGQELKKKKDELLSTARMSPDGRVKLFGDLEKTRVSHAIKAGELSRVEAGKKTELMMGQFVNQLAFEYLGEAHNPAKLMDVFGRLDERIQIAAGQMTPNEEIKYRQAGRSMIVYNALNALAEKNPNAAEDVLTQTPGMNKILTPEHGGAIVKTINAARAAASKPIVVGKSLVTPSGKLIYKEPEEEKLQEVGDPTSSTGSRFVPQSEAKYAEGRERKPLVTSEETYESAEAKALGTAAGKKIEEIEKNARDATKTLSDIQSFRAGLESGSFPTGIAGRERATMARLLKFFGAETEFTQKLLGSAPAAEVMETATKRLAVGLSDSLSRVTNMGLQFIDESLPNLTRTPEGNAIILDIWEAGAKRAKLIDSIKEDFLVEHKTLRPQNKESFEQRIRRLDDENPVITADLKQRIVEASKMAPKSWKDVIGVQSKYDMSRVPKDFTPPSGFNVLGVDEENRLVLQDKKKPERKFYAPVQ